MLKKDEVTGECRKVHNEDLYALYSSPTIVRMIKVCGTHGRGEMCIQGLGGETCGKEDTRKTYA